MKEFGGLAGLAMAHPRFVRRVRLILVAQSQYAESERQKADLEARSRR